MQRKSHVKLGRIDSEEKISIQKNRMTVGICFVVIFDLMAVFFNKLGLEYLDGLTLVSGIPKSNTI